MEKEIISKYGRSITVHHKRRIQYTKGDILGNNITFLEEVEPDTRLKSKSSNKLVNFRKALEISLKIRFTISENHTSRVIDIL